MTEQRDHRIVQPQNRAATESCSHRIVLSVIPESCSQVSENEIGTQPDLERDSRNSGIPNRYFLWVPLWSAR